MSGRRRPRRAATLLRRGGGVALLTAFLGIVTAAPAAAHPYLLTSDPPSGAILATAPSRIDIGYTEGLDRAYCTVTLIAPDGHRIQTRQVPAGQSTELSVAPDQPLAEQGTYAVNWTAVGDDGHTVIGSFGFSVGHPSADAAVQSGQPDATGSASSPGGARRLLRTVLPFAIVVLAAMLLLGRVLAGAGRRAARLRWSAYAAVVVLEVVLGALMLSDAGTWSAFWSSAAGARLIAEVGLTALALPAVAEGGVPATGGRPRRWRFWLGVATSLGLLFLLADSGHAATQPGSRRDLALAVYSVHLLAVSVWIGALIAVLLGHRARSLRSLVGVSLVAVLGTGVATTDWGLRTLSDVPGTAYGKLSVVLLALFVVMVWMGTVGGRRVMAAEAAVAVVALLVAGALGQSSLPLDEPYSSQAYATSTGMPLVVTATGEDALDVATLAPGILGRNTLVVEVGRSDEDDFLSPAPGVHAVSATLSCGGCGEPDQKITLHSTGAGAAWTGDVSLSRAASWLVTATVKRSGEPTGVARFAERVTAAELPHQVVVGVPAALSGPTGETCRDEVAGLQVALEDVNAEAADRGDLIRVAAVDLHDGVPAAMDRLRSLGARLIAMPCGTALQVQDAVAAAHRAGLPVVGGASTVDVSGVFSTQPSWRAEGAAIGAQALRQDAVSVTALVGRTGIDRAELAGIRSSLGAHRVTLHTTAFPAHPRGFVSGLQRHGADVVALLGDRTEAAGVVHALSAVSQDTGWAPEHGILASAQLMSTDFINDAGTITRLGGIEFASDVNPFDPVAQYYAQRLRSLIPGVRPSFDGLHGYEAGLAIAEAFRDGGGRPAAASLRRLLGTRFADFTVGSYRLGWAGSGGSSTSLAFFRSTYVNPMAMPADTPGGAPALAHEGTFLDTGGFEQVAPFRRLS